MYNGLWWDCSSGGSRGQHPPPPPHFFTKMRPERPKKIFWETEGLDLPLCRLMEKTLDNVKNDFFHNSNN